MQVDHIVYLILTSNALSMFVKYTCYLSEYNRFEWFWGICKVGLQIKS